MAAIAYTEDMRPSAFHLALVAPRSVLILVCLTLTVQAQTPPDQVLLKDYRPHSIFKIPETRVEKARYSGIDVHSHNYVRTEADLDNWVNTMDAVGLERTVILSGNTGSK